MPKQFQTGNQVLVYYQEDDDLQPGVIVGTNSASENENLLYTVKVDDRYWVGKETNLFSAATNVEDAAAEVEAVMQELEEKAIAERASFEEEQRRLEERTITEELEETEAEEETEVTERVEEEI
jgi:hypothetical protein